MQTEWQLPIEVLVAKVTKRHVSGRWRAMDEGQAYLAAQMDADFF